MSRTRKSGERYRTSSGLYFRVQEETQLYVADFFTEDGAFVATYAEEKDGLEGFLLRCDMYAFLQSM